MQLPSLSDVSNAVREPNVQGSAAASTSPSYRASLLLMGADVLAILLSLGIVVGARAMTAAVPFSPLQWMPYALLIIGGHLILSAWRGIYPGYGSCAIAELRSTFYSVSGAFAFVIVVSFVTREAAPYDRSILLVAWALCVPVVYAVRAATRKALAHMPWYGTPVVVIGEPALAQSIVDALRKNGRVGLRPTLVAVPNQVDSSGEFGYYQGVPVISGIEHVSKICAAYGIRHAIVAMPTLSTMEVGALLRQINGNLQVVSFAGDIVHPSVMWISNSHAQPVIHGEVEYRLRQPPLILKKRLFDIAVSIPIIILATPVCFVIACLIKLTSPGPIFYRQIRVGHKGEMFSIVKFRTMHVGAEQLLATLLSSDEDIRNEYVQYRKIKQDPRVNFVGAFLRRYSLDELPQLWNVLVGDMSLVGIRPMLDDELQQAPESGYPNDYQSIPPGLTGLWQVTMRNEADFTERIIIDRYYLYNWSLFLDVFIVAKTIGAVVRGRGAY